MTFKTKDCIEHPTFGNGKITRIRSVRDDSLLLEVMFENGISKQLNSRWVEEHCKHIPFVPYKEPKFKKGTYLESEELSDDKWKVFIEETAPFTDETRKYLKFLKESITPGINFVQIHDFAVVALDFEEGADNRSIERAAQKHMLSIFNSHPDFGYVEAKDGIVLQMGQVWLFLQEDIIKRKNGEVSLETLLAGRNVIFNICYQKILFSIIRSDLTTE